ncbi:DUF1840 domain-containing protein [Niveibacterium sp. 24ML]|uniref:DUF1840 domain-containing protein n=1 Tax=Niveibacterium sp. 24ML TaxID=2985512 RepID=UPI00226ED3F2|nr:DUF1840 domain-containing protein [Niveibacterium sp. 24ML]MCX9155664.1 DUF1840 domain-containing protein [Niveibacterium sp. 24ML]
MGIITFKSRAAGDVIMFGKVAQAMLELIGKDPLDARGIVTVAQLPAAIAALRQAAAADKARAPLDDEEADPADAPRGMGGPVALWQRAAPLIELMEYSLKEEQPVIWE